jgi:hypothetical protein
MHESRISVSVFICFSPIMYHFRSYVDAPPPSENPTTPTILFLPLKLLPPTLFSHHALRSSLMSGALFL